MKMLPKRREFLMLAKELKLDRHDLTGWYFSEKLDGMRAFWDGGISRGMCTTSVPWANVIHPRTNEPKTKIKPYSTGLWSRYGNPIIAPDWFLNKLPVTPLDGELWAGRKNFQLCRSICAGDQPDTRFDKIQFAVFDSPPLPAIFRHGEIKNANFHLEIKPSQIKRWFRNRQQVVTLLDDFQAIEDARTPFKERLEWLEQTIPEEGRIFILAQHILSSNWQQEIETELERIVDGGGEGLMFRDPEGLWEPKRLTTILKYKPFEDAEANIVGVIAGQKGKTGQMLGKIGSLICETRIRPSRRLVRFEIGSGFTMDQRMLKRPLAGWAKKHPGEEIPCFGPSTLNDIFSIDDRITFKYRELSDEGIPKEPRFWRTFIER